MNTDTVVSVALVLIVLRQISEHKLELHVFLLPLALVSWAALHYLHGISLGGNDPLLIAVLGGAGALVGALSGAATRLRLAADGVRARAGLVAAGLWIASMGARGLFVFAIGHGFQDDVARFSAAHHLTSAGAWAAALIAMALAEVAVRLAIIFVRAQRLQRAGRPVLAAA